MAVTSAAIGRSCWGLLLSKAGGRGTICGGVAEPPNW